MADEEEFAEFVAAALPGLLRFGHVLTGNAAAAEDLVQTALGRSLRAWRLRRIEDPRAFVRKVMVNSYASWHRRHGGREWAVGEPAGDSVTAEDAARRVDDRDAVWRALRELPPRQRTVVVLRYYEDLVRPGALAIGPQGQVYVADDGLDQILQALPGGRFKVIAGNGRRGYSGDGGPAVAASLNGPGGMTVARNGTIYFADTQNNRVRAVWPSGTITTVAGTGRYGNWAAGGSAALRTSLGGPAAVAVSPGRCLYIADEGASEILRLDAQGRLIRVAGVRGAAGIAGTGRAAAKASADGPDGLAFDHAGNLYVAGANTKTLLMITAGGRMRLPAGLTGFYPRGPGGLTSGRGGVVAMNGQRVQQVTGHGLRTLLDFSRENPAGIRGFLPDGIAVTAAGAIYLDTHAGNGYTSKTALIEVEPSGRIRVIWQS